jgi:DNA-binding NarL/FixJ family response regulator
MIRVVLADDHQLIRDGITSLLEDIHGVVIVGEASDGLELLDVVSEKEPDIALVDISMPRMNGIEVTARIVRDFPKTRVIILSMHHSEEFVMRAVQAGAAGYLPKDSSHRELGVAIEGVAAGGSFFASSIGEMIVRQVTNPSHETPDERLSSRQREILQLIAEGNTSKEVGITLSISTRTVETHRRNIMTLLDIRDLTGLVRYAIRTGIITA